MSFSGFDLSQASEVRLVSFTLGPGGGAQVWEAVLEVDYDDGRGTVENVISYGDRGPAAPALEATIWALNQELSRRRGGGRGGR